MEQGKNTTGIKFPTWKREVWKACKISGPFGSWNPQNPDNDAGMQASAIA